MAFLLLVPLVGAEPQIIVEDPTGDVAVSIGPSATHTDAFPSLDFVALGFEVVAEDLVLSMRFASLETDRPILDGAGYSLDFNRGGVDYRAEVTRIVPVPVLSGEPSYQGQLLRAFPGADDFAPVMQLAAEEVPPHAIQIRIPLDALEDAHGRTPVGGEEFSNVWAASQTFMEETAGGLFGLIIGDPGVPISISDRIPDEGPAHFLLPLPESGATGFLVSNLDGVQWSNGNSMVISYPLAIRDLTGSGRVIAVEVVDAPEGWTVWPLDPQVTIPPGQEILTGIVAVTTPRHTHGGQDNITLGLSDDVGAVDISLGLLYPAIPELSGHHPTLYLHSRPDGGSAAALDLVSGYRSGQVFMSATRDHPEDQAVPITETSTEGGWTIPLAGDLHLGLQFREGREGSAVLFIEPTHPLPLTDLVFSGDLFAVHRDGTTTLLARMESTQPIRLEGATELEATMTPVIGALPPEDDLTLQWRIEAEYQSEPPTLGLAALNLLPGSTMHLPLLEYVPDHVLPFESVLTIEAPARLAANPGDVVAFAVTARNPSNAQVEAELDMVTGSELDLHGTPSKLSIPSQGALEAGVHVRLPEDAAVGTSIPLLVRLAPTAGGAAAAIVMLDVVDDPAIVSAAWPDTAPSKKSPLPSFVITAALLIVASTWTRWARNHD